MSAADMQNVSLRFYTRWVSWGFFAQEEEEALDDEYKYGDQNTIEDKAHYYYVSEFVAMRPPTPSDMQLLAHQLALFHAKSAEKCDVLDQNGRPQGRFFGYHTTTHNGKLAQDNTWTTTWEEHFTRNMRRMLNYNEKEGGERSVEAEYLLEALFEKVMPRLLRPMEMYGRRISPSLCHGDVWEGNVGVGEGGEKLVFDPGCFWGHGECKIFVLGRYTRGRADIRITDDLRTLNKKHRDEYLRHVPATYPEDDFEARIMLYHLCVPFPSSLLDGSRMLEALVLISVRGVVCMIVRFFPRNLGIDGGRLGDYMVWVDGVRRD